MTWKPTDEMVKTHTDAFWATQRDNLTEIALFSALIAVQPLIAAEAMERAAQIADAFVASADEGPLDRVDTFQNMAAESIAAAIRFASAGNTTVPLKAELEASMAEIARLRGELDEAEDLVAELTMAIQRFIDGDYPRPVGTKYRDDGKPSKHDQCPHKIWMYEACDACASDFFARSLIPKPVEGT